MHLARWSITQTKNRETEPSGIGWELFLNYKIALQKYKPDYFLYENNKSMSRAIREQICRELGVEPVLINSAKLSAQNRERLYWVGKRNQDGTFSQVEFEQPEDRGILLKDILDSGLPIRGKGYTLKANYAKAGPSSAMDGGHFPQTMVMEPVRIGSVESGEKSEKQDSQAIRVYSPYGKSVTLSAGGGGQGGKTGLYAVPCGGRMVGRRINEQGHRDDYNEAIERTQRFEINKNPYKTNCISTVEKDNLVIDKCGGGNTPIYEVKDGKISINGKQYPIRLPDGYYIIRKLTVTECKRLQTVPDDYEFPVSNTQAYKMLGNGWTVDVIYHIMSFLDGIKSEPVEVLSMYDGMSCGRIALKKIGANVIRYYATEIDKWDIKTTQHNFPDTIQLGDAFQVRDDGWSLKGDD